MSKQWTSSDEPVSKKAKIVLSSKKVMITVFGKSEDVIYIDFLKKGKRITGLYHVKFVLDCLVSPKTW